MFFFPSGINRFIYLRTCFISCLNWFGFNLINDSYLSKLSIPFLAWRTWGLCTSGSIFFVYICMKLITLTFNNRKKIIFFLFNILCKAASIFSFFSKSAYCWQLLLNLFIPLYEFLIFLSFLPFFCKSVLPLIFYSFSLNINYFQFLLSLNYLHRYGYDIVTTSSRVLYHWQFSS